MRRLLQLPQNRDLRAKILFRAAVLVAIAMLFSTANHYSREKKILEEQTKFVSFQLGDLMLNTLHHAFVKTDFEMVDQITNDIGLMEIVDQVQVVGFNHRVIASSSEPGTGGGNVIDLHETIECGVCHDIDREIRPLSIEMPGDEDRLRFATPIMNEAECAGCHADKQQILGVILIDVSLAENDHFSFIDFIQHLSTSLVLVAVVAVAIYQLFSQNVLRRIERFHLPLTAFSRGDFSVRVPEDNGSKDEIYQLTTDVNRMMARLETYIQQEEEMSELQQAAVVEERERIARELHDGLAQMLTYIGTKTTAVRLMVSNDRTRAAMEQLLQLEEAVQGLFTEVRSSILDLKSTSQIGKTFPEALRYYIARFSNLSRIPVDVSIAPALETMSWGAHRERQMLRIVQESLTNTRKHASADNAWVKLWLSQANLELEIGDDGVGFDAAAAKSNEGCQFGLQMMEERADTIGADLELHASVGQGVRTILKLPIDEGDNE